MIVAGAGSLKVTDFGIARVLGASRMTRDGNIVGTIQHMSREQVMGCEADARSDIYSLGILLYEMLTGRVPFSSMSEFELMRAQVEVAPQPPREFASHIPLAVEQVIMRSLARRPNARFQTTGDFRSALLKSLDCDVARMHRSPSPPYVLATTRLSESYPPTVRLNDSEQPSAPDGMSRNRASSDKQLATIA